jgi:beta-lactamase superfamily II metal-dependent hydrolase
VGFGDAILVSIPDRAGKGKTVTRHILIDLGNVLAGRGGVDSVFDRIVDDIMGILDGRPLDLYVMTHEHMDHVQGLLFAHQRLAKRFDVAHAWLTASAAPDYYDRFPGARQRTAAVHAALDAIDRFYTAAPERRTAPIDALLLNNNYRATGDCVAHLRTIATQTTYVYRGRDLRGRHPFVEAKLRVLAPERDTTIYYGSFQPMALGVVEGEDQAASPTLRVPVPPAGVDAGAFYNLVEARRQGHLDNLLTIDHASNNSSVVLSLEWRGWKLLFPGDAELRSWKEMDKRGLLEPVHFIKVGHHGSSNGTPPPELLDKVLPTTPPDERPRRAIVSTRPGTFYNVPDSRTLRDLRRRCELLSVGRASDPDFIDIEFESD